VFRRVQNDGAFQVVFGLQRTYQRVSKVITTVCSREVRHASMILSERSKKASIFISFVRGAQKRREEKYSTVGITKTGFPKLVKKTFVTVAAGLS